MDDKTLVDRLRNLAEEWFEMCDDIHEPLNEAATRIEALEAALRDYMSAFGQALEANGIPFSKQQREADEAARQALESQS